MRLDSVRTKPIIPPVAAATSNKRETHVNRKAVEHNMKDEVILFIRPERKRYDNNHCDNARRHVNPHHLEPSARATIFLGTAWIIATVEVGRRWIFAVLPVTPPRLEFFWRRTFSEYVSRKQRCCLRHALCTDTLHLRDHTGLWYASLHILISRLIY